MSQKATGSFVAGYEPYWRRTTDEVRSAIKVSAIVLDTNSIVNLYRMASGGREEYFTVLESVADRIWVPRQVVDEFHRVRLSAVASHISGLKAKAAAVTEASDSFKNSLRDFARLYSLANGRVSEYMEPLDTAISSILEHVHGDVEGFDLDPGELASNDPILDRLAALLDGKVGLELAEDQMRDALDEAKRRGEKKIPPGYKDWQEKGSDGAGDYLIWREMLTFAQAGDRGILFVSTDIKEDWLRRQAGFVIGPRPELVKEMWDEAGCSYHHITLADFLRTASEVLGVFVSPNTINRAQEFESDKNRSIVELEERVSQARYALMAATTEQAEHAQALAAATGRDEYLRGEFYRLGRQADGKGIKLSERAVFLGRLDVIKDELDRNRDTIATLSAAVEQGDGHVAAARAQTAFLEAKLAERSKL